MCKKSNNDCWMNLVAIYAFIRQTTWLQTYFYGQDRDYDIL